MGQARRQRAATRIQAAERGRQTRAELSRQRASADASSRIQAQETAAATRIQASYRGHRTRAEQSRRKAQLDHMVAHDPTASPGRPEPLELNLGSGTSEDEEVVEEETEVLAFSPVSSSPGDLSPAYRGPGGASAGFRAPPIPASPLEDGEESDESIKSQRALDFGP